MVQCVYYNISTLQCALVQYQCISTLVCAIVLHELLITFLPGTNKISQAVTGAHEGGIFSICILKDGSIITGGKDRRLVHWSNAYKKTGQEIEVTNYHFITLAFCIRH